MRLVAVSQRVDFHQDRNERRDALDQRLGHWLKAAGFIPVPVPNIFQNRTELDTWLALIAPVAIVLSGGNDIGQTPERDHTETLLLEHGAAKRLPVLGICRGLQMMVAHGGGTLVPVESHVAVRHPLRIEPSSSSPWPDMVNSFHAWGATQAPPGYVVQARAADGCIEALRHESLPWEGWMWHPEREAQFNPADIQRLQSLVGAS